MNSKRLTIGSDPNDTDAASIETAESQAFFQCLKDRGLQINVPNTAIRILFAADIVGFAEGVGESAAIVRWALRAKVLVANSARSDWAVDRHGGDDILGISETWTAIKRNKDLTVVLIVGINRGCISNTSAPVENAANCQTLLEVIGVGESVACYTIEIAVALDIVLNTEAIGFDWCWCWVISGGGNLGTRASWVCSSVRANGMMG